VNHVKGQFQQAQLAKWQRKECNQEDTEALGKQRAKPSKIKARYSRPTCKTARTFVHHHNGTQYCSTEMVFLIFSFLQTNSTSQMWPRGGKGSRLTAKKPAAQWIAIIVISP